MMTSKARPHPILGPWCSRALGLGTKWTLHQMHGAVEGSVPVYHWLDAGQHLRKLVDGVSLFLPLHALQVALTP